jgi:hypothetical protein
LDSANLQRCGFPVTYRAAVAENQPIVWVTHEQNRMRKPATFREYEARLREFMLRHSESRIPRTNPPLDEAASEFNELALALFSLQFEQVPPYRQFCQARRKAPGKVTSWQEIPALPAIAFKEFDVSSLPEEQRQVVFHSSGTTEQRPSRHFHNSESLELYEASLAPWFQSHLLPDRHDSPMGHHSQNSQVSSHRLGLVILTPSPALAPHSSLVHMFETVRRESGSMNSRFTGTVNESGAWGLDLEATSSAFLDLIRAHRPIVLLSTAYSLVQWLDHIRENNLSCQLPPGSRVLETGGYKGRSRELPKVELHRLITQHLGIPENNIVCEYGMSELSSQAYDRIAGRTAPPFKADASEGGPVFQFPPWARAQVISPESGCPVAEGEMGLIRVFDLANVRSVLAIQTEDLGIRRRCGFDLAGRALVAEPRGCSLMSN